MYKAWVLADVYRLLGARREALWIFERLHECRILYPLTLGEEYQMLEDVEEFADLVAPESLASYAERKREIDDIWLSEVEAAAPDDDLAAACNYKY